MRCLLVHAHPLEQSLTRHFLETARASLVSNGHEVEILDLYPAGFDPRLTAQERAAHYAIIHDHSQVRSEAAQLEAAQILILVFPTWWFGLPAIMKGWIDRVFAPGVAFDQGENFGPIKPRLTQLKHAVAITTLGSPWWVDWIVMHRPLRRVLKTAVIGGCAPNARFKYLPFYAAEKPEAARVARFEKTLQSALQDF